MNMHRLLLIVCLLLLASAAVAKQAVPTAADPLLEKRVHEITSELRCLVCQNQTIADSNAELAVDLKNQVREMVDSGRSDSEIMDYMVQRYGDFVLYRPPVKGATFLLWAGPFLLLAIGLLVLAITLRRRNAVLQDDAPISAEDSERIRSALAAEENTAIASSDSNNEGGENKS